MTTLAIPNNAILAKPSTQKNSSGFSLYDDAKSFAGLGANLGGAAVGAAAAFTFGTFAEVIPGKDSVPDWFFKFLAGGGAIFSGYFLYKVWKLIKKEKQADAKTTPFALTDETLVKNIGNSVAKVSANSDKVLGLSLDILNGSPDNDTIAQARNLFTYWTNDEIKNIVTKYRGRPEIELINGNGIDAKIYFSDLKDRLAVLTGYIVETEDTTIKLHDDLPQKITDQFLGLEKIEDGTFNLDHLVPDEFAIVYSAARHYVKDTLASKNDSITEVFREISTDASLAKLKNYFKGPLGPDNNTANNALTEFKKTYNYLKVLQKAIEYVISTEGQTNISAGKARNVAVLKAALISGLGIKFDPKKSVNNQLREYLEDVQGTSLKKGLKYKVSELERLCSKLQEAQGEGSTSIGITKEDSKDKTYGNIFTHPTDEFIVFDELIKEFSCS